MPQDDKTRANALIDQYSDGGGLNIEALCDNLSKIVMTWTLTVFEIFEILTERQFTQRDHEWMATSLINRINPTNLIQLAQSIHGQILLQRIRYIMNCEANNNQQICKYIATADARAKEIQRETAPRQLSEEEIKFFIERGENQKLWMRNGKTVIRKLYDPLICWDLPVSGAGFITYTIDDLKRTSLGDSKYGYDQIGTKETIEAMILIAKEWNALHSNRILQYGDISRPGGINTPDHGTHRTGKAFDMRLLRKDTQIGGFEYTNTAIYSRELTKQFILMVVRLYPGTTVYFNDAELHRDDRETRDIVDPSDKSHNNHLHVMFPGGRE